MNKHLDAFIGIDYGTTSCKLVYITPPLHYKRNILPAVENLSFTIEGNETSKRYPSSILFESKGQKIKIHKGFDVTKIFKDERKLNAMSYQLVNSPKLDLGKGIFYPIAPPKYCEPEDLVYLTLDEMLREFERTGIKRKNCKIIVTVPSSFGVQQRKEIINTINRLDIGAEEDYLVDEPNAALLGLIPSPLFSTVVRRALTNHILLMDFGGGTCDISLLKIDEDFANEPYGLDINNLAINDYAELGGNKIDYDLAQIILSQIFHPEEMNLFNEDILKIEATDKLLDRLAKTYGQKSKEQIVTELSFRNHQGRRKLKDLFLLNIERIKLNFKTFSNPLEIPRKNRIRIEKEDFERIIVNKISGDLMDISTLINNVVNKADLEIIDIGAILLAGGSSKIFQVKEFREKLLSLLPHLSDEEIILAPDPDLLISTGAAIECYNRFFLGKSLIRPICPSNIGIRTAENENVCLIKAGKGLPYPNRDDIGSEEILYAPNSRSKKLKIPLYIEKFDVWNIFEIWDIALPDNINPGDKMLLAAKMHLDKTLEVTCSAAKDKSIRFKLSSENWLSNIEPTAREQKINDLRLKIKMFKKEFDKINFNDLYDLILEEYLAGYYSIAKTRCLGFLESDLFGDRGNAHFYNFLGLVSNAQRKYTEGIQFYKKAVELFPSNDVFNYNVGISYLWHIGDSIQAEKYLNDSLNIYSNSYSTYYYLGKAKEKNRKENEAKSHYREALSLVKEYYSKQPDKRNIEFYCKICDELNLEYPQDLKNNLTKISNKESFEDIPIGLSDKEQIIRLNPDYNVKEVNKDEED